VRPAHPRHGHHEGRCGRRAGTIIAQAAVCSSIYRPSM
jgi:hypothetical protein